jgi:hypothetical protein
MDHAVYRWEVKAVFEELKPISPDLRTTARMPTKTIA